MRASVNGFDSQESINTSKPTAVVLHWEVPDQASICREEAPTVPGNSSGWPLRTRWVAFCQRLALDEGEEHADDSHQCRPDECAALHWAPAYAGMDVGAHFFLGGFFLHFVATASL